jgi:hypothetical protein
VTRPAKKILLVGDDEEKASVLRYLLVTQCFRVTLAGGAIAAEYLLLEMQFDLLLLLHPLAGAAELLKRAKRIAPHTPTLAVSDREAFLPADWVVDSSLCRGRCSSAAILERVKVMVARRPGPRGGEVKAPADPGATRSKS